MIKQWNELKETIIELRDNDGKGTQQEVCRFLANLMDVLEKQVEPERKTGEWISKGYGEYRCSSCRNIIDLDEEVLMSIKIFDYCPYCGSYNGR